MGSSESKIPAATKPEPAFKKSHVSHLIDPRSPSTGIDRTPIQVGAFVSKTSELESENPSTVSDPRSPTVGVSRTPVRDVMTATVGSFARRLGLLFHSETQNNQKTFVEEELPSTEPLLHPTHLDTPVLQDLSDFVILEEPQVEVEVETEADVNLEEATESRLHKRLSLSLITCHEGTTSSTVLAEVHHEASSFTEPSVEVEPLQDAVEHSYALPAVGVEPESPEASVPCVVEGSPAPPVEPEPEPASADTTELAEQPQPPCSSAVPSSGIRCPTFDPRSPSQVVFKPQWLGKGFGAPAGRSRAVHAGKGGSSPLAVRVAVKNVTNENKGHCGKPKQKGSEGRSPLQILKETNSPRDQRSQMKLKVSTPDKQRSGPTGRRVLVSLDKENR